VNVSDFIYSMYNGILRFGTITEKKMQTESSHLEWAYFRVDWHDDGQFTSMVRESDDETLRKKTWWRVDKLCVVDSYHLGRSLYEHQSHKSGNKITEHTSTPVC